jgi:thiamine-phosphate pyrophosphorylase
MFPFYFITDPVLDKETSATESVMRAIAGGARLIQYRDKVNSRRVMYENAKHLREITAQGGASLIINDQIDLALAVSADGAHLGQNDLPIESARKMLGKNAIIGISTHTLEEAIAAALKGADYIGFGPIFPTATKENPDPVVGVAGLREVRTRVRIPIVAIGGINAGNIAEVVTAGADCCAVVSAVLSAPDPAAALAELMRAIH